MTRSRDGSEIKYEPSGKLALETFKKEQGQSSIFEAFQYMDEREMFLRKHLSMSQSERGLLGNANANAQPDMMMNYNYMMM